MKSKIILFMSMVMLAGVLQAVERFYIVKQIDMIGGMRYKIMKPEEYKVAAKEVQEEMRIFRAVVTECKKEWKADKERKGSFASSKIKARKISKSGATYPSMEKAEIKFDRMEESSTEKRIEDLKKHAKKFKGMNERSLTREEVKLNAVKDSLEMVSKKMEEKLGRSVPNFGFEFVIPNPNAKH